MSSGPERRPFGLWLLAAFFLLAAAILLSAGPSLLWPGTPLDAIWRLNPSRRAELQPYAAWLAPFFILLAGPMIATSVGVFLLRRWAWWLAVVIFAVNLAGDVGQLVMGRLLEGAVGVGAVGLILVYLLRPGVRAAFGRAGPSP